MIRTLQSALWGGLYLATTAALASDVSDVLGFRIDGVAVFDTAGQSVSGAGDVNGDGLADLIIASEEANNRAGESYVVFGKADTAVVKLRTLIGDENGFPIRGINAGDQSGVSVSGAGDVNGDGLADVIIGTNDGAESYVVFGKTDATRVNLATLSTDGRGFRIHGVESAGKSVSGAGDVNGDGLADVIVGARFAHSGGSRAGASYVVFGKNSDTSAVDLDNLGPGGFRILGGTPGERSGASVSGAGDVNGDGLADVIIGAPSSDPDAGRSYVVFGKMDVAAVDLGNLAGGGFRVNGVGSNDELGDSVAGAGDVNGDGLADLIIGAPGADFGGIEDNSGAGYVVFGKADDTTIELSSLGTSGFVISGFPAAENAGLAVSGAGDVNADGLADILVRGRRSESYIVLGKADSHPVDITTLTADGNGFVLDDNIVGTASGSTASGAGDVNGDGLADLILGAPFADPDGVSLAGSAYVIFGGQALPPPPLADLNASGRGVFIGGISANDRAGASVSAAGDVNDDGIADVIIGASGADAGGPGAGESYVVFGSVDPMPVDLASLGTAGFRLIGAGATHASGTVAGAGDVNGDGFDDVLIGAPGADPFGRNAAGQSYVVCGKADPDAVDLGEVSDPDDPACGFRIDGAASGDRSGLSVSGAGDVNGDGRPDVIVGARFADPGGVADAGASYVVYGKSSAQAVDLANLAAAEGFRIRGINPDDQSGASVAGAGDVNGDGFADLVIGAPGDPATHAGESYLVFGAANSGEVDLAFLGGRGFVMAGTGTGDRTGTSVAGAGDVNGDGLADLIVGAPGADPAGVTDAGATYVVFGKADPNLVELQNLTAGGGFVIRGDELGGESGLRVSGAGDVNGDGLADLLIGAANADPDGVTDAGASYVVFGKADSNPVDLGTLAADARGFRIGGSNAGDFAGSGVSAAGDFNDDGVDDLIVGARGADNAAGRSYVVFGRRAVERSGSYSATALPGDAPPVAVGISGDGSNDSTPDARAWVDFADGGSGPQVDDASMVTVNLVREAPSGTPGPTARVHWELGDTDRVWSSASVSLQYTDAEIQGLDEQKLTVLRAPSAGGPWIVPGGSVVDAARNRITVTVTELGVFAITGSTGASGLIFHDGFED